MVYGYRDAYLIAASLPANSKPLKCQAIALLDHGNSDEVLPRADKAEWACIKLQGLPYGVLLSTFDKNHITIKGKDVDAVLTPEHPFIVTGDPASTTSGGVSVCSSEKPIWTRVCHWWDRAAAVLTRSQRGSGTVSACVFDVNPYNTQYLLFKVGGGTSMPPPHLQIESSFDRHEAYVLLAGMAIYFAAPFLAGASVVQLIFGFAAGMSIIFIAAMYIAYRALPGRNVVAFTSIIYPATATYLLTGFIPLAQAMIGERWFQWYCALGGVGGVIWAHIYPITNQRTLKVIERVCQAAGIVMVYSAPSHPVLYMAAPLMLLLHGVCTAPLLRGGHSLAAMFLPFLSLPFSFWRQGKGKGKGKRRVGSSGTNNVDDDGVFMVAGVNINGGLPPSRADGRKVYLTPSQHRRVVEATTQRELDKLQAFVRGDSPAAADALDRLSTKATLAVRRKFLFSDGAESSEEDIISLNSSNDSSPNGSSSSRGGRGKGYDPSYSFTQRTQSSGRRTSPRRSSRRYSRFR